MSRFSTMMILWLAISAAMTFAQQDVPPAVDAAEVYRQHATELTPPVFGVADAKSATRSAFPGDNAQFVSLQLNNMFPQRKDLLVATLHGLKSIGAFTIVGRHTVYNENTMQQTSDFFEPKPCGFTGYCPGGISKYQNLEVHSTQISGTDLLGDHALDFALYDGNSGRLIQQVFVYYYVGRPSAFGRMYHRLDSARLISMGAVANVQLIGQFPVNQELVVWAGNLTAGVFTFGPAMSLDGKTIKFGVSPARYETPTDFVILFPAMRLSWSLPNGLVVPAATSTPVPTVR